MKLPWFSQLKIWSAIDKGTAPPQNPASPEIAQYTAHASELERLLRQSAPPLQSPPGLHGHIMTRLRAGHTPAPCPRAFPFRRWIAGTAACAVVLLAAVQLAHRRESRPASPVVATTPIDAPAVSAMFLGDSSLPGALLDPLNHELDQLARDLQAARTYILASIP